MQLEVWQQGESRRLGAIKINDFYGYLFDQVIQDTAVSVIVE